MDGVPFLFSLVLSIVITSMHKENSITVTPIIQHNVKRVSFKSNSYK